MKKFSKLLLVFVAVLSSVFFLFYKLKYDRLYNVMQVLEVFGSPSADRIPQSSGNVISPGGMISPYWREIENHIYVYSIGHCSSLPGEGGTCPQVKVLGLVENGSNLSSVLCVFWYEGSLNPLQGTFSIQLEDKGVWSSPATLSCESKYTSKVPYGISFYSSQDKEKEIIPVKALPPSNTTRSNLQVCILPPPGPGDRADLLKQNILFHALIGVTRFILYHPAPPHTVLNTIANIQQGTNVEARIHPWSSPRNLSRSEELKLISLDCHAQSKLSDNYILLQDSRLIVPTIGDNIATILSATNVAPGPSVLKVRRFCSEYPDDKKSSNVHLPIPVLHSTYFNKQLSKDSSLEFIHTSGPQTSHVTNLSHEVSVNEYGPCDRYDFSETDKTAGYDTTALKFTKSVIAFYNKYT